MTVPCEQKDEISQIRKEQEDNRVQSNKILLNQELLAKQQSELVVKLDRFFTRLEELLVTDMERRKDIEQLARDQDLLYASVQAQHERIETIEHDQIRSEGLSKKVRSHHEWFLREQGWRRLLPHTFAFISCIAAVAMVIIVLI